MGKVIVVLGLVVVGWFAFSGLKQTAEEHGIHAVGVRSPVVVNERSSVFE